MPSDRYFSEQQDSHLRDLVGSLCVGDFYDEVFTDCDRTIGGHEKASKRSLGNVQSAIATAEAQADLRLPGAIFVGVDEGDTEAADGGNRIAQRRGGDKAPADVVGGQAIVPDLIGLETSLCVQRNIDNSYGLDRKLFNRTSGGYEDDREQHEHQQSHPKIGADSGSSKRRFEVGQGQISIAPAVLRRPAEDFPCLAIFYQTFMGIFVIGEAAAPFDLRQYFLG